MEPASTPESLPPKHNTVLAVIAYISILSVVSYLAGKDDSFVKFHARQGLVLFAIEVVLWVVFSMLWSLWFLWQIVNFAIIVLAIIGIVNAVQGKEQELPLVGNLAKMIPN